MLQIPNLDDREFNDIYEEAIKYISQFNSDWTNMNQQDPGITFLELLAWLTDMQQYYLNRITVKNQLKFLKLLGCSPKDSVQAETVVNFDNFEEECVISKGTKLIARNDTIFETLEEINYVPCKIDKVLIASDLDFVDSTLANENQGVYYYPFGFEAKKGNKLYIGFDKALPIDKEIRLSVKLFNDYPIKAAEIKDDIQLEPLAKVSFTYFCINEGKEKWSEVNIIKDETFQFLSSGVISFKIQEPLKASKIKVAFDKERYWLCFNIEEEGFQISPRVYSINMNAVRSIQKDTMSIVTEFDAMGEAFQEIVLSNYIDFYGKNLVQIKHPKGGFEYWEVYEQGDSLDQSSKIFWVSKDDASKKVTISFGDGNNGSIPVEAKAGIRVISFVPEFEEARYIGNSSGEMEQNFYLPIEGLISEEFKLQVGYKYQDKYLWKDYDLVQDFDASTSQDLHYRIDREENIIIFGDNEKGSVPPRDEENNICIISCSMGDGQNGNINEYSIDEILIDEYEGENPLKVTNLYRALGGKDKESIEAAKSRVLLDLKDPHRAVTAEDYERIARETPGMYISKTKAIPLFEPGMNNYPKNKAPGHITVVVVPYCDKPRAIPGKGFFENIRRHLNKYRMMCTQIHVIPPVYIKVSIIVVVVVQSEIAVDSKVINQVINKFFNNNDNLGWELGKTLLKGDLYELINGVNGVEYINELQISVEGREFHKTNSGDIEIPAYGFIYPGEHEIVIKEFRDL